MNKSEALLTWLLRFAGIIGCMAIVGVLMPYSWLVHYAAKVDPGFSEGMLFPYLARSASLFALLIGLLLLAFSMDVRRHRAPISVFAVWSILGNLVFCVYLWEQRSHLSELLNYDLIQFILGDAACSFVIAVAILILQSRIDKHGITERSTGARGDADS
jgi:hypothetical protein